MCNSLRVRGLGDFPRFRAAGAAGAAGVGLWGRRGSHCGRVGAGSAGTSACRASAPACSRTRACVHAAQARERVSRIWAMHVPHRASCAARHLSRVSCSCVMHHAPGILCHKVHRLHRVSYVKRIPVALHSPPLQGPRAPFSLQEPPTRKRVGKAYWGIR